MRRSLPSLLLAAALALAGCDLVGTTPFNDAPQILRFGDVSYVDAAGNLMDLIAQIPVMVGTVQNFDIVIKEPEGETMAIGVGPVPRGWNYASATRRLVARPDDLQLGLQFDLFVAAEDSHTPPAYDVRMVSFVVQ